MKRKIVKAILSFITRIAFRIKIIGKENMPKDGAYILCGNHIHALDAPVLVLNAPRKIRFIAKVEIFENSFLKFLGDIFEAIPIKRGAGDMEAMKKSLETIKNGDILGIFPEGTRNGLKKGAEIKTGAAFLALKTNTKVIPIGTNGTFKPFSRVTIKYGKPMDFSEYACNKPDKAVLEKVSKEIMSKVQELAE